MGHYGALMGHLWGTIARLRTACDLRVLNEEN